MLYFRFNNSKKSFIGPPTEVNSSSRMFPNFNKLFYQDISDTTKWIVSSGNSICMAFIKLNITISKAPSSMNSSRKIKSKTISYFR